MHIKSDPRGRGDRTAGKEQIFLAEGALKLAKDAAEIAAGGDCELQASLARVSATSANDACSLLESRLVASIMNTLLSTTSTICSVLLIIMLYFYARVSPSK